MLLNFPQVLGLDFVLQNSTDLQPSGGKIHGDFFGRPLFFFKYFFELHVNPSKLNKKTSTVYIPKIGGPKSWILTGFSIINHPFGVPLFLETPIYILVVLTIGMHNSRSDS